MPERPSGGHAPRPPEITQEDFKRLHRKLIGHFRHHGASPDKAEDLAQETFLRAHRSLASFEGRSALDTWIVSIAKHVWLQDHRNQGRDKRRAEEVPFDELPVTAIPADPESDLAREVESRQLLERTCRAVKRLPEPTQQALFLSVRGLKHRAIAELLEMTENGVASLIHQARKKLRSALSD